LGAGAACAGFFEWFYILVRPAYCSKYVPPTALLFVLTIWLHWLMPALVSGACVALLHRIVSELMESASALLGALLMVSLI
jgi:hypothetical protein